MTDLTPEKRAELREKLNRRSGPTMLVLHFHLTALLDAADERDRLRAAVRQIADACHWSHDPSDDPEALVAYIVELGRIALDAADERDRLAAQVERVRALHSPASIYLRADECGHDPEMHDVIESITGEEMCWDSPTGDFYCTACGGDPIDELPAHPCETIRALDGTDE